MPVAIFLLLAVRSRQFRPSVGDVVLFGVTVAAGFSMYENILYARGTGGGWLDNLPFSPALPFLSTHGSMLVGGHVVYTALASLGLRLRAHLRNSARPLSARPERSPDSRYGVTIPCIRTTSKSLPWMLVR